MASNKRELEFEDLLEDIGGFGKYQKRIIFYYFPIIFIVPTFTLNIIFLVYTPDHWCHVPEVTTSNLSLVVQRSLVGPPENSSCFRYDLNFTEVLKSGNLNVKNETPLVACDEGWDYDTSHFEYTAATKWSMVCADGHYSSLVMTLTNVGSIIGTPIYGTMADRMGRKPVFFIVIVVASISSFASILVSDFITFLILRIISGSSMPSVYQLPFIIIMEMLSPDARVRLNGIQTVGWTFGVCIIPLVAYLSSNWVTLGLVTSVAPVLMLFFLLILPESPRWLIWKERYGKAVKILTKVSETNGKHIDPVELRMKMMRLGEGIKKEKAVKAVSNTGMDLLRYPNLRKKFLIVTFCCVADILAYNGLLINVYNLVGNPFVNFFLLAAVEFPGVFFSWYFMDRWGRRWCTVSSLSLTGVSCLFGAFIPEGLPYGTLIFSLIGKLGSSAAFMVIFQQSSELYPTTIRSIGMSISGTCASMANIIVPYIIYLAIFGKQLPLLIIGIFCIVGGACAILLPETLNEILPQTINDAEMFGKEQGCLLCISKTRTTTECSDESPEHLKDLTASS